MSEKKKNSEKKNMFSLFSNKKDLYVECELFSFFVAQSVKTPSDMFSIQTEHKPPSKKTVKTPPCTASHVYFAGWNMAQRA